MKIAALFVDHKGPYKDFPEVDLWDIDRDARCYRGPWPVIAHPPCARWGKLAPVNHKRWGTPIGEDGGCFVMAYSLVKRYGGVLEHPKDSIAFKRYIRKPKSGPWQKISDREWIGEVWQSDYGHLATKKTWLYYVGDNPPEQHLMEHKRGEYQVGGGVNGNNNRKPRLKDSLNHITPKPFAEYLVRLAKGSRK